MLTLAVLLIILFSLLREGPVSSLSTPLAVLLRPLESMADGISAGISGFFGTWRDNAVLVRENKRLRAENVDLRLQIQENEQARKAYETLKAAFALKDRYAGRQILAGNILERPLEEGYAYYRLDLGSRDGLEKGVNYAVLDENAAVAGLLAKVDGGSSVMIPLTHEGFSLSAHVRSDAARSFRVHGSGVFQEECELIGEGIAEDSPIQVGDAVYSAGSGGIFPEGLYLGKVSSISAADSLGLRQARTQVEIHLPAKDVLFVFVPSQAPTEDEMS